jgi:hypothetical protein
MIRELPALPDFTPGNAGMPLFRESSETDD